MSKDPRFRDREFRQTLVEWLEGKNFSGFGYMVSYRTTSQTTKTQPRSLDQDWSYKRQN